MLKKPLELKLLPGRRDQDAEGGELRFPWAGERAELLQSLEQGQDVTLYYVEIVEFQAFDRLFGGHAGQRLLLAAEDELTRLRAELFASCQSIRQLSPEPGRFLLICSQYERGLDDLAQKAFRVRLRLKSRIRHESLRLGGAILGCRVGYAPVRLQSGVDGEKVLFNALFDAQRTALGEIEGSKVGLVAAFRRILEHRELRPMYQPVVDLAVEEVFGWEVFTRGPAGCFFESAEALFDFAEDVGRVFLLEKCAREMAIRNAGEIGPRQKLFLNTHPATLLDPEFSSGDTLRLLLERGFKPQNIVFEITERHAVRDFELFARTLEHFRTQGYLAALDDVGGDRSELSAIADIRPDFLKLDMSLVRDIETSPTKQALVETIVAFAEKTGAKVVAKGVETRAELITISSIGVHYAQGRYLAHPGPSREESLAEAPSLSGALFRVGERISSIPVGQLVEPTCMVPPDANVSRAKSILLQETEPINAVVVVRDDRPVGLVMSHHLDRKLSAQFGLSLYMHRTVSLIMDSTPLVVDAETPVEKVARLAMSRETHKLYDYIIITERGSLKGVASVQKILDTLAAAHIEMAKGANPLTGLPGNLLIEQNIERACHQGQPFSIVYADLDNFKAYNDAFGFKRGDEAIALIARLLLWARRRHGSAGDFVGHVGGDDFVMLTSPERAERVCQGVIRCFSRLVRRMYSPEDLARGYIEITDRRGQPACAPLLSVSLAIVDCRGQCDFNTLARHSAETKAYAKMQPGNAYVRDRRSPDGRVCGGQPV